MKGLQAFAIGIGIVFSADLTPFRQVSHAAPDPDTAAPVAELNRYAEFLGQPLDARQVGRLEAALPDARPEVAALLAALLYRADTGKYRSELNTRFTIDNHKARAGKQTNVISQEEFTGRMRRIEQDHPGLTPPLMLRVSFVTLRDANLWFQIGDQEIAASRFLRGAFLARAFEGAQIDPVAVANELDEQARRKYEHNR